jgi:hypothetical protein
MVLPCYPLSFAYPIRGYVCNMHAYFVQTYFYRTQITQLSPRNIEI